MNEAIRDRLAAFFAAEASGVVAAYLFGSTVTGRDTAASDVDVAVLFAEAPEAALMGPALTLEGELERLLGRRVDLVSLNTAPADLVHRVLRTGELVFDRDPARRIRFEVARRNEYFDLQPILRDYRANVGRP
jgi:uncharacterized protein